MRRVWKYRTDMAVDIPKHSRIVLVGRDHGGDICVWLEVDDYHVENLMETEFRVFPTGGTIPNGCRHVGSFVDDAKLVWHIYQDEMDYQY